MTIEFIKTYLLSFILGILGIICIILTYGAMIVSKREGRYVSGIPAVGGILIIIAFFMTPFRIGCLFGLLDIGIWELCYLIPGWIRDWYRIRHCAFPDILEECPVLLYSKYQGNYDTVEIQLENRDVKQVFVIHFYAIVQTTEAYALLGCDESFHVISRENCSSVEEGKNLKKKIAWIGKEKK